MKENFLLKRAQQDVFEGLSNEDAGKLIKGIFKYVNTGESDLESYLKVIFIPIKNDIDKNEEAYIKRCETNKINGSKGGAPKGNKNAKKAKTTENNRTVSKTTKNNMINHNHIHIHNHIINYLNNKLNTKYKSNTKSTKEKINARLNEGYVLDDFIAVIDKKTNEWLGTEMEKYLRPETLFGNKFESYLNQKETKKEKNTTPVPEWISKEIKKDEWVISDEDKKRFGIT